MIRIDHPNSQMAVRANTVLKVLKGNSRLSLIDILVRESIQNSLDAYNKGREEQIKFYLDQIKFTDHHSLSSCIKKALVVKPNDSFFNRLNNRLCNGHPSIMVLSDKGTTGLSGPVKPSDKGWGDNSVRKNFANLVYEIGQNHGAELAGGSFGFGKTIFYRLSASGLVMYYSRSVEGERLAFCMVSPEEQSQVQNSTGISWWGEAEEFDGIKYATPQTDSHRIKQTLRSLNADQFWLPENSFGTSIFIFSPILTSVDEFDSEANSQEQDFNHRFKYTFDSAVKKWYWPRMLTTKKVSDSSHQKPLVYISSGIEFNTNNITEIEKKLIQKAENGVDGNEHGIITETIRYKNNGHGLDIKLGTLAFYIDQLNPNKMSPIPSNFNKISMIRAPRMVVYNKKIDVGNNFAVIAVFIVNSEEIVFRNKDDKSKAKNIAKLDTAFKDSESATHGEWNFSNINESDQYFRWYVKNVEFECQNSIKRAIDALIGKPKYNSEWSLISTTIGKVLQTNDDGFVEPVFVPRTSRNGGSSSRKLSPSFTVQERIFGDNDSLSFVLKFDNLNARLYNLKLCASSGREALTTTQWNKKIGMDFPFCLTNVSPNGLEVTNVDLMVGEINFLPINENPTDFILTITLTALRKDALVEFKFSEF
jgi:hypothetical protein